MEKENQKKFCPMIQANCHGETCRWWIGVEKLISKEGGGCAVERLALDLLAFRARGFKPLS